MSTADNHEPRPASLETVLRDAWDAFHPGQPAPLGWLTHTTDRIHDHLRTPQQSAPTAPPVAIDGRSVALRRQVWQTLRDAAAEHDIAPDAADRILHALDLPGLLRRWQVRLTVPVTVEVTATSRDDAVEAAEDAIDAALSGTDHDTHLDWDNTARDNATPGDIDTTTDTPAGLR
ncbi:hypothetical protein [Micromonospora endolithica]|uniref:Uncharacterized protein n=1 Tax=Micromonospora endolithica TaxID=230091 RepID=A0A3A9ZD77_9ACTN|nr:hypothetical protein [Micromonospora endolithica]RKN46165.1 hypothetical protein D7223_14580 [Micromonospora endolithica]TWJ25128.1 hypothetical protein JD76_05291 [Micromonospora endolithica]